jgi:hypothetical protein
MVQQSSLLFQHSHFVGDGRVCGTTISDAQVAAAEVHFQANKVVTDAVAAVSPITINVKMHLSSVLITY